MGEDVGGVIMTKKHIGDFVKFQRMKVVHQSDIIFARIRWGRMGWGYL